jgi:C4-dicarboxylate transporter, DctM subunit
VDSIRGVISGLGLGRRLPQAHACVTYALQSLERQQLLIQAEVPLKLLDVMQEMISSKLLFLLVLNVFLVIVGMLMEIFAAIVVVVPLVLPLVRAYGLDPYHFAVIFVLNLEIAYLLPPLGINLFISSIRFGRPVTTLYRSVLSFIVVLFVTLMVVSYVPSITTWLPSKVATAF